MNPYQQKRILTLSLAVTVSFCCSEKSTAAQGDFGSSPVRRAQPSPVAFQPPVDSQTVLARPQATWPDRPVQYDDLVKQANLEQSAGSTGVKNLIGSTVDSAGQLLGSWKDKIGQQTDQLLSSSDSQSGASSWLNTIKQKANSPDLRRMLGSLALVVGGYLALVVVLRKFGGSGQRGIPAEVVSVLGNLPYGHKQNLRLVRLGSKLVLLLNGPEGTHPIGEITNPDEVEYLASLCQGKKAVRPPAPLPVPRQADASNTRGVTEESLAAVLRRLEQATRGGTANYEA